MGSTSPEGGAGRADAGDRRAFMRALRQPGLHPREFAFAGILCATVTGILFLLRGTIGYWSVGLIYLLSVVLGSFYLTRWPVLALAGLSAFLWNYFFIPPQFTIRIDKTHDAIMLVTYFAVALVLGHLGSAIREREQAQRKQKERADTLYSLARSLHSSADLNRGLRDATDQLAEVLKARAAAHFLPPLAPSAYTTSDGGRLVIPPSDRAAAESCLTNGRPTGRFTSSFGDAANYYHPLVSKAGVLGLVAIAPTRGHGWTPDETEVVESFAAMITVALEKQKLEQLTRDATIRAESEKLYSALLDSVSHELKTPLAVISGTAEQLEKHCRKGTAQVLVSEIRLATQRLSRTVNSLLDMTRLETGRLQPQLDWQDVQDIVNAAAASVGDQLHGHPLRLDLNSDLPPVRVDFVFIQQAIGNLLSNAAQFSPEGGEISVGAALDGEILRIEVRDRGPGIPTGQEEKIFEKFYRGRSAPAGGMGLGLSIARRFVEVHGGSVQASNQGTGGACLTIRLPVEKLQNVAEMVG